MLQLFLQGGLHESPSVPPRCLPPRDRFRRQLHRPHRPPNGESTMGSSATSDDRAGGFARPARGVARARNRCGVAVTIAALTVAWAGVASAQPTAADRETARSLMQEARDLRDKGHTQDALKRF